MQSVTTYDYYYPGGGSSTPEYATAAGLRNAIATNAIPYIASGTIGGSAPSGKWLAVGWQEAGPAGEPYLQLDYNGADGAAGHFGRVRFRFSTAILGTLDPSAWWNGSSDPTGNKLDPFFLQDRMALLSSAQVQAFHNALPTVVLAAGLCTGEFFGNFTSMVQVPDEGASANLWFGIHHKVEYDPSPSETVSGYFPLYYDVLHGVAGGLSGYNVSSAGLAFGEAQQTVPVVTIQSAESSQGWNDLNVTNTSIATSIVKNVFNDINTVINVDDLGEPGQTQKEPDAGDVENEVFTTGYAVAIVPAGETALVVGGTFLGWLTRGIIAGGITLYRLLENLPGLWAAISDFTDLIPQLPTATSQQTQSDACCTEMARIADALEGVLVQLKASSPPDESTMFDKGEEIRASLDAVATSRSEIELQMKGIRVQAVGGVLEGE